MKREESSFPFGSSAASSFQFGTSSSSSSSTSMFGQAAGALLPREAKAVALLSDFQHPLHQLEHLHRCHSNLVEQVRLALSSEVHPRPPFGGQSFTFGGQPVFTASSPFAQSATTNAAPFLFGTPAFAPSQSVFPCGATMPSPLPSGAQQPSGSSSPFTFGAQPGASPSGQPFSFRGQPDAPVQSPFSLPGATSQNAFPSAGGALGMSFAGGFSLCAACGEKYSGGGFSCLSAAGGEKYSGSGFSLPAGNYSNSSRKFTKAKGIGGAKWGK